jgi:hypothetical protein
MAKEFGEKISEKTWVVIIERSYSSNADSFFLTPEPSIDVKAAGSEKEVKEFLQREAGRLEGEVRQLQKKIRDVPKTKHGGQPRPKAEIEQERRRHQEELAKTSSWAEALQGKGRQPIKINVVDGEIETWEFPRQRELSWALFIRDNHPELIYLPNGDKDVIQRLFFIRYDMKMHESGAVQRFDEFRNEIRGMKFKEEVYSYFKEITERFRLN